MKKVIISVLVFLLISVLFADSEPRGLTCDIADLNDASIDGTAKIGKPASKTESISGTPTTVNREEWNLVDSVNVDTYLKSGCFYGVGYNSDTAVLEVVSNNDELCFAAMQAVQKSPAWLRTELTYTLSQLEEEKQQLWAGVINEAQHPYIDEIAYTIAKSSVNYLACQYAYPELFIENAFLIYAHDQDLSYVEIVDYGTPYTDENYYSTTRYWKKSADGTLSQVEVPRDIYYMYLVHLKITDEIPAYIAPSVLESNSSHQNNIVSPTEGEFWRNYLYEYNDPGYPILKNFLMECDVLWNGVNLPVNTAVGACTRWIGQSMQFTSNNERPHQPVRIYKKHIGRCGEHADLRAAVGRAALIPVTSILTISGDHTWNEFWDEGWIHWDGGCVNNPLMYENGWGKTYGTVFEIRSDGMLTSVIDTYSEGSGTLNFHVLDSNGDRVDGATCVLGVMYDNTLKFDNVGFTDNEGIYSFQVGEGRGYYARIYSGVGNIPSYQLLVSNVQDGEVYDFTFDLSGVMPNIPATEVAVPTDGVDDYKLVVDFEVPHQILRGDIIMDDLDNTEFYNIQDGGTINFSMADFIHYNSYWGGYAYDAFNILPDASDGSVEFDMPIPDLGYWYAFFDNKYRLSNPQHIVGSFKLYAHESIDLSGTISGTVIEVGTDNPISGAEVFAGAFVSITDADGNFSLEVYPNIYNLVCEADGYLSEISDVVTVSNGGTVNQDFELFEAIASVTNVETSILENGNVMVSWQEPEMRILPDNRELMGYNVYVGNAGEETQVNQWSPVGSNIAETSYEDFTFPYLPEGIYRYAVRPIFAGDQLAPAAFSDLVYKDMLVDVTINVSTNCGDSPEGASVSLINQESSNTIYSYPADCDETGTIFFCDVLKGIYTLQVNLTNFNYYLVEDIEINETISIDVELIETISEIQGVAVINYMASWDPVQADEVNRSFQNYNVFVDDMTTPVATISENYYDVTSIGSGLHEVGISAVFSSGESAITNLEYEDGNSMFIDIVAHFELDGDATDSSGNGNDGEIIGGITFVDDGVIGLCAEYDEAAEYILASDVFTTAPEAFTISWWVLPDTTFNWNQQVRSAVGWNAFNFHTTNEGTIYTGTTTGTRFTPNTCSDGVNIDEWQFFAYSYDNGNASLYKNGHRIAHRTNMNAPVAWEGFQIGQANSNTIDGKVDDVRVWERWVGTAEIQYMFTENYPFWGTIEGTVTSAINGDPVEGAEITIGMFEAVTDASGFYTMDIAACSYPIIECVVGDCDVESVEDIVVTDSETMVIDFEYEFVGNEEPIVIPQITKLYNNYPNPFNPVTIISYNLANDGNVSLEVYNIKGQKIATLVKDIQTAGNHQIEWRGKDEKGKNVSSGIYFYQLKTGNIIQVKKMILMK